MLYSNVSECLKLSISNSCFQANKSVALNVHSRSGCSIVNTLTHKKWYDIVYLKWRYTVTTQLQYTTILCIFLLIWYHRIIKTTYSRLPCEAIIIMRKMQNGRSPYSGTRRITVILLIIFWYFLSHISQNVTACSWWSLLVLYKVNS